jgi:hypothetical protein
VITFARFPGDPVPEPGNGNAVSALVAEAFADVDESRSRELDRLLKTKYANTDPRQIPPEVLHQPREDEMPKERQLCSQCKTNPIRSDNKKGICNRCARPWQYPAGETVAKAAAEKSAQKPARHANRSAADLDDLTTDELLELRDDVDTELRSRLEKVNAERRALCEALGTDGETTPA